MPSCKPNGRPGLLYDGNEIVAADAVALVAGVNFRSVQKIITAIDIIEEITGTSRVILTRLSDVPLYPAMGIDVPADPVRLDNTEHFCRAIAASAYYQQYDSMLYLKKRLLRQGASL